MKFEPGLDLRGCFNHCECAVLFVRIQWSYVLFTEVPESS